MNVLEAVKQLDKYNKIVSALNIGEQYLKSQDYSYEGKLLSELAEEYNEKATSLKDNLEKTNLATMR